MNVEVIVRVYEGDTAEYTPKIEARFSETVEPDVKQPVPVYNEPGYGRPVANVDLPYRRARQVLDYVAAKAKSRAMELLESREESARVELAAAQAAWDEAHPEDAAKLAETALRPASGDEF